MKKALNYSIIVIILILTISANLYSQLDKETVYKKITEKYGNAKSITMNFNLSSQPGMKGTLKASRGNKYFVKLKDRTLVCNGKTVWNYSTKDNNVVISNFESSENDFSIESFFFNFLNNYKPVKFVKESSSDGNYSYVLTLEAASKASQKGGIKSAFVRIDIETYSILNVEIVTDSGVQSWDLKKIITNVNLPDKIFEFTPPKDSKIVDLR
jgi:outer membrane lipoprotein-sorting protein